MKRGIASLLIFLALLTSCAMSEGAFVSQNLSQDSEISEPADSSQVSDGEFVVREMSTSRDGMNIYAEAYIPVTTSEKVPTVIMSHGFNNNYAS